MAEMLDEDEGFLADLAMDHEPEDGWLYRGSAPAINALIAGRIQFLSDTIPPPCPICST